MYAIIDIEGQQLKVAKDQKIFINRLKGKEGTVVNFDKVLLIDNDKAIIIGEPVIKGAVIKGKILSHIKGDKVKVFKKKRRKGFKVLKGHRQPLTEIQIEDILEKTTTKPAQKKESEVKKTTPSKETAKVLQETDKKASPKTTTVKKGITKAAPAKTKTTSKASSGTSKTIREKTQELTSTTKKSATTNDVKAKNTGSSKKKSESVKNKSANSASKK